MKYPLLFFCILSFSLFTKAQTTSSPLFNESNYTLHNQGADTAFASSHFAQYFRSNQSGNYAMKKTYVDGGFTQLLSVAFYKDSLQEGPFKIYNDGKIALQGTFKNGKWDGERLTYNNEVLVQKAFFTEGVATGSWEEYNRLGQLKRKITFDASGNIASDVKY